MPALQTASRTVSLSATPEQSRAASHIFSLEPTSGSQARTSGSFYVVTETQTDSPEERGYCRVIADTLREEYYRDSRLPLGEALGKAIERANYKVHHEERYATAAKRPVVAVTCIAVRDGEAIIGQTLPVQTYISSAEGFAFVPNPVFWEGDLTNLDASHVFGQAPTVKYHLLAATIAEGDMIAVCSSALAQSVDDRNLETWMATRRISDVTQGLRRSYTTTDSEPAFALIIQANPDIRRPVVPEPGPRGSKDVVRIPPRPNGGKLPTGAGQRKSPDRSGGNGGGPLSLLSRLSSQQQRTALLAVGVVVVVIIVIFGTMKLVQRFQSSRQQGAFTTTSAAVSSIIGGAAQARDPSVVATAVSSASSVFTSASAQMSPPEAATVQASILQQGDPLLHIARLSQVKVVLDRSSDTGTVFTQIAVSGNTIYLLDSGNRQVVQVSVADNKATAVLTTGRIVGNDTVDAPVAIAAFPQGLLVVDKKNNVWQLDNATSTVRKVTVPGSDAWGTVRAIATYGTDLYVLDVRLNRVWKYPILAQGIGSASNYFAQPAPAPQETPVGQGTPTPTPAPTATPVPAPDVTHASDMAMNGTLYIVQAGGAVLKFVNGVSQPFSETNLPQTMPSPSHILAAPNSSAVFVVDPTNNRIVQFGGSGEFQRQILLPPDAPKSVTSIQAASIDESRQLVYLVTEKTLSTAVLPK